MHGQTLGVGVFTDTFVVQWLTMIDLYCIDLDNRRTLDVFICLQLGIAELFGTTLGPLETQTRMQGHLQYLLTSTS